VTASVRAAWAPPDDAIESAAAPTTPIVTPNERIASTKTPPTARRCGPVAVSRGRVAEPRGGAERGLRARDALLVGQRAVVLEAVVAVALP
jgi:hypothetical protein